MDSKNAYPVKDITFSSKNDYYQFVKKEQEKGVIKKCENLSFKFRPAEYAGERNSYTDCTEDSFVFSLKVPAIFVFVGVLKNVVNLKVNGYMQYEVKFDLFGCKMGYYSIF